MLAYKFLLKKMKKNLFKKQLLLESLSKKPNFTAKMLRWVNTTSAKMQMGDKLLSPICFIVLLTIGMACQEKKSATKFIPYKGPLEEAEKLEVLYSEEGLLKVRVKTEKQIKSGLDDKIFPKQIFVDFFGPNGQVMTTLVSDSGRYDSRTGMYRVIGNVKVVNTLKQERLLTDELTWNPNTKKVYTEKPVMVENQMSGEQMKGIGLDANQDFTQYSIRRPTGFFNAPAGMAPN
jgi:LPS export ABC transporter protein LptC